MRMRVIRPLLVNHIASPYGLSLISTLIFLVGWAFPPDLYTALMREPDLMFLDVETLLFFLSCLMGFWLGLILVDFLLPTRPLAESNARSVELQGLPILLPLIVTTGMTIFAAAQMVRESPAMVILLFSQQGAAIKFAFADTQLGPLGWGLAVQTVVLWWTYWKLKESNVDSLRRRPVAWLIFIAGLFAQIAISALRVSRSDLLPVFTGLGVLFLLAKIRQGQLSPGGLLRYILVFGCTVLALFTGFAALRGVSDLDANVSDLVGYTLASYNRLTALLQGRMHYPYGGHGAYLFVFLTGNSFLNSIIPIRSYMGWPDFFELWNSEFQAVRLAGLNQNLIWSGAFGYLFSDFGWATPLVLIGYGIIYQVAWIQAKLANAIGVTLYPWFAFSLLCWFSANLVFDHRFPFYLLAGILLLIYEKLLGKTWVWFTTFARRARVQG